MKKIIFTITLISILGIFKISFADDFYYSGMPQMNYHNGRMVISLPPPPPMNTVPWYVRDDWDDYVEDYYKCILGYDDYYTMTCRFWRNYAEKNGFYQNPQTQQPQVKNNGQVNSQQNMVPPVQQPMQPNYQNNYGAPLQTTPPANMQAPVQPYNQNGYVAPNGHTPTQNNGYVAPNGQAPNNNGYIPR